MSGKSLKIALLGDVMLGRRVGEAILREGPEYVWGDTIPILRSADIRIANLECPISERGVAKSKPFTFRAPPAAIPCLKAAGIDCVSLANNHTLDFGLEALSDTLMYLDEGGIAHSGAGMDLAGASRPAFIERAGLKVALASMTDNMPNWSAAPGRPGINYIPLWSMPERVNSLRLNWFLAPPLDGISELLALVRWNGIIRSLEASLRQAESADMTILSCHWGPNWRERPYSMFRKFAKSALGMGADIVHGHSAHVFQGIEAINGRPVLYDAGDFLDDYSILPARNDLSFIQLLEISADSGKVWKITLVPTKQSHCRVSLARGDDASEACSRMERLCRELGTKTGRDGAALVIEPAAAD